MGEEIALTSQLQTLPLQGTQVEETQAGGSKDAEIESPNGMSGQTAAFEFNMNNDDYSVTYNDADNTFTFTLANGGDSAEVSYDVGMFMMTDPQAAAFRAGDVDSNGALEGDEITNFSDSNVAEGHRELFMWQYGNGMSFTEFGRHFVGETSIDAPFLSTNANGKLEFTEDFIKLAEGAGAPTIGTTGSDEESLADMVAMYSDPRP